MGALRLHSMIFGPSGFGKTTTILEVIKGLTVAPAAAPFRIGTIFVTMKPEADITESLRKIAQATGRGFHVITQDGHGATETYNPLRHGTAQMRANVLVGAESNAAHSASRTISGLVCGPRWWRWRLWRRRWPRVWRTVQVVS